MKAKYWMTFLVFSVLPAPDSPLQSVEIFFFKSQNHVNIK